MNERTKGLKISAGPDRKARILAIDDDKFYLKIYLDLVGDLGYECLLAEDGLKAIDLAKSYRPDLIITDVLMPGMGGFELSKRLKQDILTMHTPILMVTTLSDRQSRVEGLAQGADEFLSKPIDETEFRIRIKNLLKIKQYEDFLVEHSRLLEGEVVDKGMRLKEALEKIKSGYIETVYRLTLAAEYRDNETGKHIRRISLYSQLVARYLKLDETKVEAIFFASPMHDIGKIGIPDYILLKPGRLTKEEYEIMKSHTTIGTGILRGSASEMLKAAEEIAFFHHEMWDGQGYPNGLRGEEIPLAARIVKIADSYDAIRSKRPYKKPFDHDAACIMLEESKAQFDPLLLDIFHTCNKEFQKIFEDNQD